MRRVLPNGAFMHNARDGQHPVKTKQTRKKKEKLSPPTYKILPGNTQGLGINRPSSPRNLAPDKGAMQCDAHKRRRVGREPTRRYCTLSELSEYCNCEREKDLVESLVGCIKHWLESTDTTSTFMPKEDKYVTIEKRGIIHTLRVRTADHSLKMEICGTMMNYSRQPNVRVQIIYRSKGDTHLEPRTPLEMMRWATEPRKMLERMAEEMREAISVIPFETFYSEFNQRLPPGVQSLSLGLRGPSVIRGLKELTLRKCKEEVDASVAHEVLPSDISDAHMYRGPRGMCWIKH